MRDRKRTEVRVNLDWDEFGNIIPKAIYWRNGLVYEVDRVLDVQKRPAMKVAGVGDRYTVRLTCEEAEIFGKTTYLYLEKGEPPAVWFVEEKE